MPAFFIGLLALLIAAVWLKIAPVAGIVGNLPQAISHLWLPSLVISLALVPILARVLSASIASTIREEFVEVAIVRGVRGRTFSWRYLLRPSIAPTLSLLSYIVGTLFASAVVVELVFNLPGTGTLLVNAVAGRDYPLVQGIVLISGVFVVIVSTVADIITVQDRPSGGAVRRALAWFRALPRSGQVGVADHPRRSWCSGSSCPQLSPYGRARARTPPPTRRPSLAHPFGTDQLGRDIFTRSFAATHLDIFVAVVGVLIPLLIGTVVGALAATTDIRVIRGGIALLIDGINAFPFLILALGVIAVVGHRASRASIIAIALTSWARYAKLARTRAATLRELRLRERPEAARLQPRPGSPSATSCPTASGRPRPTG